MSQPYQYKGSALHQEEVSLDLVARSVGTPTFVYSKARLIARYRDLRKALAGLDVRINYSVKANSNLSILSLLKNEGAGFDIVSAGELSRVLTIGGDPKNVVFSGVGKSIEEIDYSLKNAIGCINVESTSELNRIIDRSKLLNRRAPVSIRVNPNIDPNTHPYISTGLKENKFGVSIDESFQLFSTAHKSENIDIKGIDCHIGSQISDIAPLSEAVNSLCKVIDKLAQDGIVIDHINVGGGLGVTYKEEEALSFIDYGNMLKNNLKNRKIQIFTEPGRSLVSDCGILLCRVEYLKKSAQSGAPNFAIVDAGMNDLIRPALYGAWHDVLPVQKEQNEQSNLWNIVGPICESSDFLAKQRALSIKEDSLLAIMATGAYGMSLSSNYNSRGRPCEVLVDGADFKVIRKRETINDQIKLEKVD